jgi:hypothetical protein
VLPASTFDSLLLLASIFVVLAAHESHRRGMAPVSMLPLTLSSVSDVILVDHVTGTTPVSWFTARSKRDSRTMADQALGIVPLSLFDDKRST